MSLKQKKQQKKEAWEKNKYGVFSKKPIEFTVDTSNLDDLKKFFDDHYDYKPYEIALKFGMSVSTIRYLKRKVYGSGERPAFFKDNRKEIKKYNLDREIWDNKRWFHEKYIIEKLSTLQISRLIGIARNSVNYKLRRYGVPLRNAREALIPKSKYYNKDWIIYKLYVENRTLRYVASFIKINIYTLSNWLISLNIKPKQRELYAARNIEMSKIRNYYKRKKWNKHIED